MATDDESSTFATRALAKLRGLIETGQLNIGAGGPGSDNAIVQPLAGANKRIPPAPRVAASDDPSNAKTLDPTLNPPNVAGANVAGANVAGANVAGDAPTKSAPLAAAAALAPPPVGVTTPPDPPLSPRSQHAHLAAEHKRQKDELVRTAEKNHHKERRDKLQRYIILIICVVVIILALLGLAAISRIVSGKWWHGQRTEPPPGPGPISHSTIFPHANVI